MTFGWATSANGTSYEIKLHRAHLGCTTIWSAPEERSGDGAFVDSVAPANFKAASRSLAAALHMFRNGCSWWYLQDAPSPIKSEFFPLQGCPNKPILTSIPPQRHA